MNPQFLWVFVSRAEEILPLWSHRGRRSAHDRSGQVIKACGAVRSGEMAEICQGVCVHPQHVNGVQHKARTKTSLQKRRPAGEGPELCS